MATAAFFWITIGQGDSVLPVLEDDSETWTKSYLTNAQRWSYDDSGKRNHFLTIGSGKTYDGDPATYLEDLRFVGPDNSGRRWEMTATAGKLRPHAKELTLMKGVKIRDSSSEATLLTPRLRLILDEERAVNETRVKLMTTTSTTTAIGIEIDLKSGQARLLSDVETRYDQQQ